MGQAYMLSILVMFISTAVQAFVLMRVQVQDQDGKPITMFKDPTGRYETIPLPNQVIFVMDFKQRVTLYVIERQKKCYVVPFGMREQAVADSKTIIDSSHFRALPKFIPRLGMLPHDTPETAKRFCGGFQVVHASIATENENIPKMSAMRVDEENSWLLSKYQHEQLLRNLKFLN